MDSSTVGRPIGFLDLPGELRDHIYELAIFDLPLPDAFSGLPYLLNAFTNPSEADLKAYKLHTNILLTNRFVFQEAHRNILRRAQLVNFTVHGRELCREVFRFLVGSQIAVLPTKYKSLCVLRHEMRNERREEHPGVFFDFVLCGRDIEQFCHGLMGDVHYFLLKPIHPSTSHTFTFLRPRNNLYDPTSTFLAGWKAQQHILEPYHIHLGGFPNISFSATLPGEVDKVLETAVVDAIKTNINLDTDEFRDKLAHLAHLPNKLLGEGQVLLAVKLWIRYIHNFYQLGPSKLWRELKLQGGEGYAESIAEVSFRNLSDCLTVATEAISVETEIGLATVCQEAIGLSYVINIETANLLGIPGWSPTPAQEAQLNYTFAYGWRLAGMASMSGDPLGHMAIRRAVEISPDDEKIQRESQEYQRLPEDPQPMFTRDMVPPVPWHWTDWL